jgi:hypothetical protein
VSGIRVAALIGASLFGVAACAPVASFRPAAPLLEERSIELGVGGVAVAPRPYVQEPWRGAGQVWAAGPISRVFDLGGVVAFDLGGFAAGGSLRAHLFTRDRFALAADLEAGWAWAALAIPVAVRLFDETWLYTAPRFGNWGGNVSVGIPLGLSVRIRGGFHLRAEAQIAWPDFDPYQRRVFLGLAAAQQL